jgi:hypothetical protein
MGFTCDEELVPFVLLFYKVGFPTGCSFQGSERYAVQRRPVTFGSASYDPHKLLDFCLYIQQYLFFETGWSQSIEVDTYHVPRSEKVFAELTWTPDLDAKVLRMLRGWRKPSPPPKQRMEGEIFLGELSPDERRVLSKRNKEFRSEAVKALQRRYEKKQT